MKQFYIFKSLMVIFLMESVSSLGDVYLNNLRHKTVASLMKILSRNENDVKSVIIQPNKRNRETPYTGFYKELMSKDEGNRIQRPETHSILIKRLIPHGLPPSKLEFDRKYKTLYRPLVRVHKRKTLPQIATILNIDGTTNGMDKYGIDFYDYFDNDENVLKFAADKDWSGNMKHFKLKKAADNLDIDEGLLQPFSKDFIKNNKSPEDVSKHSMLLKEIKKLLSKIRSRSYKMKIYQNITKVLDKLTSLRSHQKSGEDNDPMAPGKPVNLEIEEVQEGPPKPKKWIPHYAPWNFWTYKKIIYQDTCPAGQVKIANLCIWVPPH